MWIQKLIECLDLFSFGFWAAVLQMPELCHLHGHVFLLHWTVSIGKIICGLATNLNWLNCSDSFRMYSKFVIGFDRAFCSHRSHSRNHSDSDSDEQASRQRSRSRSRHRSASQNLTDNKGSNHGSRENSRGRDHGSTRSQRNHRDDEKSSWK